MSSLTTNKGIVHYEVYGRGDPVIFLHGWLGSWGLWQETMTFLGQYYRTYALDFWGFGESGKKNQFFEIDDFVSMIDEFMEELGIISAPLVGHSMGGTVSLSFALQYPERVTKVAVIGSPINGESLSFILKLAGIQPIAMVVYNSMWALKLGIKIAAPFITRDSMWYEMISQDLSRTTVDSFLKSISSLHHTDLTDKIHQLNIPIMGMYGSKDNIVDPNQWKPLSDSLPYAHIQRLPDAGHFPMLDQTEEFQIALRNFLDL